jgi:hypothetical protein
VDGSGEVDRALTGNSSEEVRSDEFRRVRRSSVQDPTDEIRIGEYVRRCSRDEEDGDA